MEEIKQILAGFTQEMKEIKSIVTAERDLNAQRYQELKLDIRGVLRIVVQNEEINTGRYHEVKGGLDDVRFSLGKMVTRDQFNKAFESLSEDIRAVVGDHVKLEKKVARLMQSH